MAEYMYNLDMFSEGTSAPKPSQQIKPKEKKKLHLVEETPQVRREKLRLAEKKSLISTLSILAVSAVLTTVAAVFVFFGAYINSYDHKIADLQKELDIAESQNVILNIKKDSMVSYDSVMKTAEQAGMIQRDRYQVTYFELSQDNYGVTDPTE